MSNHHATQEARGDKSDTSWMPMARCRDLAPENLFPERRARSGSSQTLFRGVPGEARLSRVHARKPNPSRRVGRILRAGAAPDRQTAPEDQQIACCHRVKRVSQ